MAAASSGVYHSVPYNEVANQVTTAVTNAANLTLNEFAAKIHLLRGVNPANVTPQQMAALEALGRQLIDGHFAPKIGPAKAAEITVKNWMGDMQPKGMPAVGGAATKGGAVKGGLVKTGQ